MLDINLNGSFLFAREAGKHMLEEKIKGSIILIASMSAQICVKPQKQAAYNAVSLLDAIPRQASVDALTGVFPVQRRSSLTHEVSSYRVGPHKPLPSCARSPLEHKANEPYYSRWGPRSIRVNSLSPGYMHTDLIKNLLIKEGPEMVEQWIKDIPMGRMAHPSELQGTIVWMASDASSYLNGSDIVSLFWALYAYEEEKKYSADGDVSSDR